jgi:hypothetical protein
MARSTIHSSARYIKLCHGTIQMLALDDERSQPDRGRRLALFALGPKDRVAGRDRLSGTVSPAHLS